MNNEPDSKAPATTPPTLELALERSHEVKAKVEDLADTLADTNRAVEEQIAAGATSLPAKSLLQDGQGHEAKVLECAEDLTEVTETLARGVSDLRMTETALERSQAALVTTQAALTVAHAAVEDATHRALHDDATGLPNRSLFDDRATQAIAMAERHGRSVAVMFIDLDAFKVINDTHGHAVGDATLKTVAERLASCSRDADSICRAGGDEFLFLLVDAGDADEIRHVATRIVECVSEPFLCGMIELRILPSVGVAIYPRDGLHVAALVDKADAAMYLAKAGGTSVEIFAGSSAN